MARRQGLRPGDQVFFLFIRVLPAISIFEVRTLLPQAKVGEEGRP